MAGEIQYRFFGLAINDRIWRRRSAHCRCDCAPVYDGELWRNCRTWGADDRGRIHLGHPDIWRRSARGQRDGNRQHAQFVSRRHLHARFRRWDCRATNSCFCRHLRSSSSDVSAHVSVRRYLSNKTFFRGAICIGDRYGQWRACSSIHSQSSARILWREPHVGLGTPHRHIQRHRK